MKWVHDLVDLVVLDYRVHVRASLYNLQTRRKYLDEYFEEIPPDNVTPLDIAGYKLWRRNKHNAAESTVNHELCWLRRGFALGKEQGWVEEVPKIQAYRIGNRNARSDFIPIEVLPDLLAELPGDIRDVVEFSYHSGWRKGEVLSLTWEEIGNDMISLRPGKTKEGKRSLKGRARLLPRTGTIATVMSRREHARSPSTDLVFHRNGKRIKTFRGAWKSATNRVGLKGVVFHATRRSFITNAVQVAPQKTVMELSGHMTPDVFSRYHIVRREQLVESFNKIEDYVNQSR